MSENDFPTMTTAQIRSAFLKFFEDKGCKLFESSSLVPDDPSLLLANAGMNQFKQYYLGTKTMEQIGATSCQKCLRTNDIDVIGLDGRHLSFFEMLGNFSFGGYTKRNACEWALEFITKYLQLPMDRLYFTIFTDDDDCHDIWRSLGVDEQHISRLGEDDNFWAAGPTGPCGPCSEIYFDQGEEVGCGEPGCAPGCDCDRFLEFWNLVFTQYDRQEDGTLVDLPHQNVDTGMGLERISAILQHKSSNYDGDVLTSLLGVGERLTGLTYGADPKTDVSLRIMADHSRAVTFMIADGILPSNEGRGYVLRRLLRRAVFHGRLAGITDAFLSNYVHEVQNLLGDVYPELIKNASLIDGIVAAEEERFSATLETGRNYLDEAMAKLEPGATLDGRVAFNLHDTYGFPVDLTREICEAAGHDVDMDAFNVAMDEQKTRARAQVKDEVWSNFNNAWVSLSDTLAPTEFVGYDSDTAQATVLAILVDGAPVDSADTDTEVEVVLDRTSFYGEMGGEIGDIGRIVGESFDVDVTDTKHHDGGLVGHVGSIIEGTIRVGDAVTTDVYRLRRELIRRNHTATHLLDAALKQVLGDHVNQAGSLVTDQGLRFDFTHFEALTPQELDQIDYIVNAQITEAKPVVTRVMDIEQAKASGAVALFGEKYGDVVRVVSVGEEEDAPFSRELCGGCHAHNSAELGLFKIVSESSVGANVRRIEALTSVGALTWLNERVDVLDQTAAQLKCRPLDVPNRVAGVQNLVREGERRVHELMSQATGDQVQQVISTAVQLDGFKCVFGRFKGFDSAQLREVWDKIRDRVDGPVACVLASSTPDGKVAVLSAGDDDAVAAGFGAGAVVKQISERIGGRGGGRPNMAQAGGKNPEGISDALELARQLLKA